MAPATSDPTPEMKLEVPPSAGRMWAVGKKKGKLLFPRERGSLLMTGQIMNDQVIVINPPGWAVLTQVRTMAQS